MLLQAVRAVRHSLEDEKAPFEELGEVARIEGFRQALGTDVEKALTDRALCHNSAH